MPHATRYDRAARKRARRSGRERGAHIYIPAEILPDKFTSADALWYRVDGGERGRVVVTLYVEP